MIYLWAEKSWVTYRVTSSHLSKSIDAVHAQEVNELKEPGLWGCADEGAPATVQTIRKAYGFRTYNAAEIA